MRRVVIFFILFLACGSASAAQDLVFSFTNPSFLSGNSFNASWMLAEAQAQNSFTASRSDYFDSYEDDPLKEFANSVNRQVLNQLSRQLYSSMFEENGLKEGTYEIGDYSISIIEEANGIVIEITEILNGNETRVVVPYF